MKNTLITLFCFFIFIEAFAQDQQAEKKSFFDKETFEYQLNANFSIGGSSPIPFPEEIREIKGYNPTLALGLGGNVTKWFNNKWGVRTGLSFESRGMKTKANVKNYKTEVIGDTEKIKGYFTGGVQTKVKNSYLTFPILATYNISKNWNTYGGIYLSALVEKNFSGYVYEGYLRNGTPIGDKVVFEGDHQGPYDFSENLNTFQWGLKAGGEWRMNNYFNVFADLNWGLNDLFEKDFDTISFNMYSIYLNIGFGYKF